MQFCGDVDAVTERPRAFQREEGGNLDQNTQTNNNNKTANTRQNHMTCFMFSKNDLEAAKGP